VANRETPFRSALREGLQGRTEDLAVELFARGLSTRDISSPMVTAGPLLSRAAVSQLSARLWAEYQTFASRDLAEHDIVYLFVDGIAERLRPGQPREAVLAAWGIARDGRKVLLHLMAGSREDRETVRTFFQDMRARARRPAPGGDRRRSGIIRAADECFPRAARQRCLAHRVRNLAAKMPEDLWPEFKARVAAACPSAESPDRPRARPRRRRRLRH
jgi:putative transposase